MKRYLRCFVAVVLSWLLAYGQMAYAQETTRASSEELVVSFDPHAGLFRWMKSGGLPVVKSGVKTNKEFGDYLQSPKFQEVMEGLGLGRLVQEVRGAIWSEDQIASNTSEGLFSLMAFSDQSGKVEVKELVLWSGSHPLAVRYADLPYSGIRLVVASDCGNVAIRSLVVKAEVQIPQAGPCKPGVPTSSDLILEDGAQVHKVSDGCTTTITITKKPVDVVKYAPCDPNWSLGLIGSYPRLPDPEKGYVGKGAVPNEAMLLASLSIPDAQDPLLQARVVNLRSFVVQRIWHEVPKLQEFAKRSVAIHGLMLLYNPCTDELSVGWWKKGSWWSWRSFFIGLAVGFGIGFVLGNVLKDCPQIGKIFAQGPNPNSLGPLLPQPLLTSASGVPGWAIGATVAATATVTAISIRGVRRGKDGVLRRD